MRALVTAVMLVPLLAGLAPAAPPNLGERKAVTFDELREGFREPSPVYAPFMFWFWDEPLDATKMGAMARKMAEQRMSPGYAHARTTAPGVVKQNPLPTEQFLSPTWFDAWNEALKAAKGQGQSFSFCDEYMWPTYQLAGRMLREHPECRATQLTWETLDVAGGETATVPASFFSVAARYAEAPDTTPPSAEARLGSWIWQPTPGAGPHHCYLRKTFDLPSDDPVVWATIRLTVDDRYTLYINGSEVATHNSWYDVLSWDVTRALQPGRNVIAVDGGGDGGVDALCLGLRVDLTGGGVFELTSDATWRSSATAPEGWTGADFDDAAWDAVRVLGERSDAAPWHVPASGRHTPAEVVGSTLEVIGEGDAFAWTAPAEGRWRVYAFQRVEHGVVNYLDERVPAAFFPEALAPYFARFGGEMGTTVPGVFNDNEGHYGVKLAWSDDLERAYRERTGRDIRKWMPLLADTDSEGRYATARCDWYDTVAEVYARVLGAESDYLAERGLYLTAHLWEESLQWQAQYVADEMRLMRAFTMPGVDALGGGVMEPRKFKDESSVCEFEGRRFMCEGFGAGGWGVFTPDFLRRGTNAMFAFGVAHVIPHGVFTNRDLEGNVWTPDWYDGNPMFPYLHIWADYCRRASYVNSHGQIAADVLLLRPMESVWVEGESGRFDAASPGGIFETEQVYGGKCKEIEDAYADAIRQLTSHRIQYLVTDRHYLQQMTVERGSLKRGDLRFRAVILPRLTVLPLDSADKLLAFARDGGQVYALGELPTGSWENGMGDPALARLMAELTSLPSFRRLSDGLGPALDQGLPSVEPHVRFTSGAFPMLDRHIRVDGHNLFWLANDTGEARECLVSVPGVLGEASIWDCETGEQRVISSREMRSGSRLALRFEPWEAYWLVFDSSKRGARLPEQAAEQSEIALDGPWTVSIDPTAQPPVQFPQAPPAELTAPGGMAVALEPWDRWGLDRFVGYVDYRTSFAVPAGPRSECVLDLGTLEAVAEVWLNGRLVGERLWPPYRLDLGGAIQDGPNELHVRVGNLVNPGYGQPRTSGLLGPVRIQVMGAAPR